MGNLLLDPNGRISPADFMKCAILLIIITAVIGLVPIISTTLGGILSLISIVLLYPWVVIFMKRMRDGGKSGWMCLVAILVYFVASMIVGIIVVALVGGGMAGMMDAAGDPASMKDLTMKITIPSVIAGAAVSYLIAFLINKFVPHDAHDNQYGPETH